MRLVRRSLPESDSLTRDKRFPIELAGIAFKQKHPVGASRYLRHALRIDPEDSYTNDFLGTIYFVQGNLEAALKYWNRVGKPQVENVQPGHALRTRPALVDRALAFSPAAELRLADLRTSQVQTGRTGRLPRAPRIQPGVSSGQQVRRHPQSAGAPLALAMQRLARAAVVGPSAASPHQTIYPEYFNIEGAAINVTSLVRWDAQKRFALRRSLRTSARESSLAISVRPRPSATRTGTSRQSFVGPSPSLGSMNLQREAFAAEIDSFNNGRWGWSGAAEFSPRLSQRDAGLVAPPALLLEGA